MFSLSSRMRLPPLIILGIHDTTVVRPDLGISSKIPNDYFSSFNFLLFKNHSTKLWGAHIQWLETHYFVPHVLFGSNKTNKNISRKKNNNKVEGEKEFITKSLDNVHRWEPRFWSEEKWPMSLVRVGFIFPLEVIPVGYKWGKEERVSTRAEIRS